jgi:FkbM family methyltransferase
VNAGRIADGVLRRVGRYPRPATTLLRLPRRLPAGPRASLYRSYSWPLAKRLKTEAVVPVAGGSRLLVSTVDQIGRVLAVSGVWEPNVTAAFTRALRPGDVCLDVGAHIGYFTLLASKLVGPAGHVYAFEPSPSNYEALEANLRRNGVANVSAVGTAVGEHAERALLHAAPGSNTGRGTLRDVRPNRAALGDDSGVMVDVHPATDFIPPADLERVRVVKIDVEGYEVEALRGLVPLLELGGPLSVFVEFNPGWSRDPDAAGYLEALCREHGFALYRLAAGYDLATLFPARISAPVAIDHVPPHECDLLLTR